jgi:hypothetical protein
VCRQQEIFIAHLEEICRIGEAVTQADVWTDGEVADLALMAAFLQRYYADPEVWLP